MTCLRMDGSAGQMTVEAMAALPVMLAVALVAVNVLAFMGDCAAFDNLAQDSVRAIAASPAYHQTQGDCAAQIQQELAASFNRENLTVEVGVSSSGVGYATYCATLSFAPTLFGASFSGSVFGVSVPHLTHSTSLSVDPHKPGVII